MAELDDKVIVTKSKITDIADALREEMSESNEYSLPTMVEKVHELGQGQGSVYTAGVGIDITNRVVSVVDTLMIRGSASGSVASIVDGADDIPLKSCMVAIEPVQSGSGDPSPSNVRPITGWTECNVTRDGENLWDEQWELGYYDTNGQPVASNDNIRSKNYIPVRVGSTLYIKAPENMYIVQYDKDKNKIGVRDSFKNTTITLSAETYFIRFNMTEAYGTTYNNDLSINYPSTDTSYHAYKGNTYNIEFPSEAGTVYGGTLDVTNGVLTVDRVIIDMGSLSYTYYQYGTLDGGYTDGLASVIKKPIGSSYVTKSICSELKEVQDLNFNNASDDVYSINAYGRIKIHYDGVSTSTELKTAMDGVKLVYELATPTTYNLTPTEVKTLLGINNIFADCGDVDVEYTRDATSIINWLIAHINLGA